MSGTPKDLTVSQAVSEAKPILAQAPEKLNQAKKALDQFLNGITADAPNTQAATQAHALKSAIDNGILQGEEAISGVEKLLKQFAFPLTVAGGVHLQGSGQVIQAFLSGYKGIQSAMTEAQKYISTVVLIVQAIIICLGVVISFFPNVGLIGVGGGLTLAKVVGMVGTYLNIKASRYPDAPRAELVDAHPK